MSRIIAATRAIRRDMFSKPGRLIAAALLIALPVAIFIAGYTEQESTSQPFTAPEVQIIQAKDPSPHSWQDIADALPPGYSAEPNLDMDGSWSKNSANNSTDYSMVEQYPAGVLSDALPVTPAKNEVLLSGSEFKRLDVAVGDSLTFNSELTDGTKLHATVKVIGRTPGYPSLVGPGTFGTAQDFKDKSDAAEVSWLVTGPQPLNQQQRRELYNADIDVWPAHGQRYDDPWNKDPGLSESRDLSMAFGDFLFGFVFFSLYASGFLLIFLFISPAFSLALHRHTRMFALMASQGASRRHIALAVLTFGLFAGTLGATLGVAVGMGAGALIFKAQFPVWPLVFPWTFIMSSWLVAVLGGLVASSLPAYLAGRSSLSAAMLGATPDRVVRWRKWMAVGPVLLAVLAVAMAIGSISGRLSFLEQLLPGGGLFFLPTLVSIALSAPALVFVISRLNSRGGIALRTAARGLSRKSMHYIPAVAALACASFLFTSVNISSAAMDAQDRDRSVKAVPANVAMVVTDDGALADATAAAVTAQLGNSTIIDLKAATEGSDSPGADNNWLAVTSPEMTDCSMSASGFSPLSGARYIDAQGRDPETDPDAARNCLASMVQLANMPTSLTTPEYLVGGEELLDLVNFDNATDRQDALKTLKSGGVVIPRGYGIDKPAIKFVAEHYTEDSSDSKWSGDVPTKTDSATLPVSSSLSVWSEQIMLLSPAAAKALDLKVHPVGKALIFDEDISSKDADTVLAKLQDSDYADVYISSGRPYQDRFNITLALGLVALTLITMLLVIALSASGIRRESRVFSAIGAAPGFNAKVQALQVLMVTGLALGFGFITAQLVEFLSATHDKVAANGEVYALGSLHYYSISWLILAGVVAATLLSSAMAWGIHRMLGRNSNDFTGNEQENRTLA